MKEKKVRERSRLWRSLIAAAGILALAGMPFSWWEVKEAAANQDKEVVYPVKTFENRKARFYSLRGNDGITIKYFVVKSSDGVIRAAFDACDVCWQDGKGYVQQEDFMVCTKCGRRFASVRINEVQGGCNPAPLTREIKGDKVILQAKDILEGKKYFAFGKGGGK